MAKIPVTWKRNLMKIPDAVLYKLGTMQPGPVRVTAVKQVPTEEIQAGAYAHLGVVMEGEKLSFSADMSPLPGAGRWSKTNVEGRIERLKELPKVQQTLTFESPHFGDWSKGSHTLTRQGLVYQRRYVAAKQLAVHIEAAPQPLDSGSSYLFKFSVEGALNPASPAFHEDLLYALNILQENTGVADVEPAAPGEVTYEQALTVEWSSLGTGKRSVASLLRALPALTEVERTFVDDRYQLFSGLGPIEYILGISGGNRYYGAAVSPDLLVFENIRYWNALFIMADKWQENRRLNRVELLAKAQQECIRIPHTGGWKERVRAQVAAVQAMQLRGRAAAGN